MVGVEEGAGAVIDGLAGDRHVVGVHHAVDEAEIEPARHQFGLPAGDGFDQRQIRILGFRRFRIVAGDRMGAQFPQRRLVAARGEILERADPYVARCHPRQDSAGQQRLAKHALARGHGGERPRRGNAQRRHRLADDIFPHHRAERRAPVAAARKRRAPRALQLQVAPPTGRVDHLAQKDRPAVAELRHEMPELVPGIGHGDRLGALGQPLAGQHVDALGRFQHVGLDAEFGGQSAVDLDELRRVHDGRRNLRVEVGRQTGVTVVEGDLGVHGAAPWSGRSRRPAAAAVSLQHAAPAPVTRWRRDIVRIMRAPCPAHGVRPARFPDIAWSGTDDVGHPSWHCRAPAHAGPGHDHRIGYIVPLRCWIIMKVSKVYSLSCAQRKASFLKASWFS